MKNYLLAALLITSAMINAQHETETIDNEKIYMVVDEMPSFPGGEKQLIQFLKANLKYPPREKAAQITGDCYITFVVEKDGAIHHMKMLKGVEDGAGCDQEVMRVMNLMPAWKPGKHHGTVVRTQYNLPIRFILY